MSTPKRNEIAQKWLANNYSELAQWTGSADTQCIVYKVENNDTSPTVFVYHKTNKRLSNYDGYLYRFFTSVFGLTIVDIQFILKSWFEDCYGLEVELVDVFGNSGTSGSSGVSGTSGTSGASFSGHTSNHRFSANTEDILIRNIQTRDPTRTENVTAQNRTRAPVHNRIQNVRRFFRLKI